MVNPIISVCNLSKAYPLYDSKADRLKDVLMPWRKRHRLFYALKDISFDLNQGEHLGILGVNGAGKSTLLQVLTGVLTPTSGKVITRGRVAALLELGAGFSQELSGRENVRFFLSLSLDKKKEIEKQIKKVEEFAEVGDFFDQPMKLYSSGMFVRVAFAANIMSYPDILIVDEALAVGDVRFQKKCFDYIASLKQRGTTFILVTHNVFGAKEFCNRLLFLDKGKLVADGAPNDVATKYYHFLYPNSVNTDIDAVSPEESSCNSLSECGTNSGDGGFEYKVRPAKNHVPWGREE